ncbi:glutathione S-transferase 1-like isoform X2 [Artemia franciscana]|uniref:glutathione S-transferase 1-like isoform X2 n=1 Tax=Artemia franciscana TaxID=6661 RepID=UPI0032DA3824
MSKYKLVYFNARGWAELSRLIFAYSGIPYEDFRFEREDWPTYKAESPLGQAPWLEVNGQKLPQSKAVARYLAKVANLTGVNDIEAAKCDAIVDFIMDLIEPLKVIVKVKQENPEALEDECKKHIGKLSEQILSLEKFIAGNGGEYAVGNQKIGEKDPESHIILTKITPSSSAYQRILV